MVALGSNNNTTRDMDSFRTSFTKKVLKNFDGGLT